MLVTRAVQQAGKLSEGLKALGAEPVEVPVLEIRPPDSFEPLDGAIRKLDGPQGFDWLVLTVTRIRIRLWRLVRGAAYRCF